MPSLRARIAAFRARSRFAGKKYVQRYRGVGRFHQNTGPSRPRGFRARLAKYNVHMYKRFATEQLFTMSAPTLAFNNAFNFQLSEVRGAGELTALYDQYMIVGVKVMFHLVTNPDSNFLTNTTTNSSNNFYPKLIYCRDYDNDAVEATNDLRERNGTKMVVLQPNKTVTVYVRPAVRNQIFLDGVTSATSPIWKQWIDCSTTQVPHYGLKWAVNMEQFNTGNNMHIHVEKQYYIKFKNVR